MAQTKHGKEYMIKGRKHIASSETETPAILYGDLVKSLDFVYDNGKYVVGANPNMGLGEGTAQYLEYGTRRGIKPRYWFTKLIKKIQEELDDL